MLLELSEVLACPRCGPPQVMVAVVHESVGRRVKHGFLACPSCDSRFPVDEGVVHLESRREAEREGSSAPVREPDEPHGRAPHEEAILLGAVLGLAEGRGHLLLGPGLASIASAVAALAENWEVVSLLDEGADSMAGAMNLSRVVSDMDAPLPVLGGRFRAAALIGDPGAGPVRDFARTLRPLGRLAIVRPAPAAVDVMREAGLDLVAAEARVAVATRPT